MRKLFTAFALFWGITIWGTLQILTPPPRPNGAYEALAFWTKSRAYPNTDIPDAAVFAAYEYDRKVFQAQKLRKPATNDVWSAIGPHNRGGRTLTIAFNPQNPNTIYAGSASGGLWRSWTAGIGPQAWERVPTGYPVLGVSSIAIVPNDSNTIYIGTGEVYNIAGARPGQVDRATRGTYGIGILKSSDGGQTWQKSLDWSYNQQRGVWAIKINPLNPNTVWAATTHGIYKTMDGGATWNRVLDVPMGMDLVIHAVDTNIVVASMGNFESRGYGIYRTTDGGATWTKVVRGLPTVYRGKAMLAIYRDNPDIMMASFGNGFWPWDNQNKSWLCRSENAGESWSVVSTEDFSRWQGWFAHDVAIQPDDSSKVTVVGINVHQSVLEGSNLVKKSTGTWYQGVVPPEGPEGPPSYVHVDLHDVVYHPTNPNIIYFATDGGVFRTVNGGLSFQSCNGGYQTTQFYNGFSSSVQDSNLAIGGLQDNSTVIYQGDPIWSVGHIGGDGGYAAVDPTNPDVLYGSYQFLNIRKSINGGKTWSNVTPPGGNDRPVIFLAPFILAPSNPQILYAGRDIVYKSVNGGATWSATNSGKPVDGNLPKGNPVVALAVSYQDPDVVYAATVPMELAPAGVFRTLDGGATWENITGTLPDRFVTDLAVDPTNDQIVYITFSGFGTSHVFKTTDGGQTWQDIGGILPDVPTQAVIVDPEFPQHVYVGTDIGVYVSTDGGQSWSAFNDGLADPVLVFDLSISPANRKIRLASHGNGVFERRLLDGPVTGITRVPTPLAFTLEQNYPNPFNPRTTLRFRLRQASEVSLRIYDARGRLVRTLLADARKPAGEHEMVWDGRDELGGEVASGVYLYRLEVGNVTQTRRMVLLR